MTATSPLQFGRDLSLVTTGVFSIQKGELRDINIDLYNQKEKCLVPIHTPRGETMWVRSSIVKSQQWTTVTNKKSKDKAKASSSNMLGISTRETEEDVASLTSSEEKESTFAADTSVPPTSKTRSGNQYLKQYGEPMVDFPQLAKEIIEPSTKPSVKKLKRASLCQSSPKRQCVTINSLMFFMLGLTSQHACSNHSL